ncbi:MAG TPA: 50S ribosomal protein L17 [Candidatus Eremiobacteraceae bacterium]|nr:50S ribosomal protein L17 [Candidatus Eremiobacteraceae bacterium]
MRHGKADKRLGRNDDHRRAMLRNLTTSLFTHGTIETTIVRAKEVSRTAARMITRAKKGDLHSRRLVASYLTSEDVVKKLFDVIAPSLASRPGGYTRIVRTRIRKGDAAPMAQVELLQS